MKRSPAMNPRPQNTDPFFSSKSQFRLCRASFSLMAFAGRRIGLKGGLKAVERSLGIERPREIEHVDGFEAVRLWYRYTGGDNKALDRLIDYNEADTTSDRSYVRKPPPLLTLETKSRPVFQLEIAVYAALRFLQTQNFFGELAKEPKFQLSLIRFTHLFDEQYRLHSNQFLSIGLA